VRDLAQRGVRGIGIGLVLIAEITLGGAGGPIASDTSPPSYGDTQSSTSTMLLDNDQLPHIQSPEIYITSSGESGQSQGETPFTNWAHSVADEYDPEPDDRTGPTLTEMMNEWNRLHKRGHARK
jgi:hypothetical protein